MKAQYGLVLILLSFLNEESFAQKQGNIWYFPRGLGLDFNAMPPAVLVDGQIDANGGGTEGCSSIASRNGQLLFYANGETIWNRKHEIMHNGDGLMGHFSSTNGAVIVPMPGENTKYYLFTTHAWHENLLHGLRYSVVDMCGDNGYGEVLASKKNIPLLADAGEKLALAKHVNGIDYWLVAHRHFSTAFHAFLITENGISAEVISEIGTFHGRDGYKDAIGQMKISPYGNKLALVNENRSPDVIDLFDFDNSTGKVTGYVNLSDGTESGGVYGVAFSPDQSKLYTGGRAGIFQFSLDAGSGSAAEIVQSKYKLAGQLAVGGLQLGPDGKIYAVRHSYSGIIHQPDLAGPACNFIDSAIYLEGEIVSFAFPTFLDSFDYPDKGSIPFSVDLEVTTKYCSDARIDLRDYVSGEDLRYLWQDGGTNPIHDFPDTGEYTVKISDRFCSAERKIIVDQPSMNLGPDKIACEGDTVTLETDIVSATAYKWQNGSVEKSLSVYKPGTYWLEITQDNCTARDSINVTFLTRPGFNLGNDTTLCEGDALDVTINVNADQYQWQDGSSTVTYKINREGEYRATATVDGCSFTDIIRVDYLVPPTLHLPDTTLCAGTDLQLQLDGDYSYLWSDGSVGNSIVIHASGNYWIHAFNGNCSSSNSFQVNFVNCELLMPNFFTPNGDELNESFLPMKMSGISSAVLTIYNRWGAEVFQNNNFSWMSGWNGATGGTRVPSGSYFYTILYTDIDGKTHFIKGTVALRR